MIYYEEEASLKEFKTNEISSSFFRLKSQQAKGSLAVFQAKWHKSIEITFDLMEIVQNKTKNA